MAVVDASIFVALALPADAHHQSAVVWYHQARRRRVQLQAPTILLPEVAAAIGRVGGDQGDIERALTLVGNVVEIHPVTVRLARRAAGIAVSQGIKGCDAIYVAIESERAGTLVSFDQEQLDRAKPLVRTVEP